MENRSGETRDFIRLDETITIQMILNTIHLSYGQYVWNYSWLHVWRASETSVPRYPIPPSSLISNLQFKNLNDMVLKFCHIHPISLLSTFFYSTINEWNISFQPNVQIVKKTARTIVNSHKWLYRKTLRHNKILNKRKFLSQLFPSDNLTFMIPELFL